MAKKPPKVLWMRSCGTTEEHGPFHLGFHTLKKALRDCRLGKKAGCAGSWGSCPGPVKYVREN